MNLNTNLLNTNDKPILFLIPSLIHGGAENSLCKIVELFSNKKFIILTLIPGGENYKRISKQKNVEVICLKMNNLYDSFRILKDIIKIIKIHDPLYVGSFLYLCDFFASLAYIFNPNYPFVWFVRHGLDSSDKLSNKILVRILAIFSHYIPKIIVFNSEKVRSQHFKVGYKIKSSYILHNTVDLEKFAPSKLNFKEKLAKEINISSEKIFIGCVSRFHPNKGIFDLLRGFAFLKNKKDNFHLILTGYKLSKENKKLVFYAKRLGIYKNISLLGPSDRISTFLKSIDIFISPSKTESFPNALLEAMASGLLCIATDTGDSNHIISSLGILIPPGFKPFQLVDAINESSKKIPLSISFKNKAHNHIRRNYDENIFIKNFLKIENSIL